MSLPVQITLANPDPSVCPATFAEAINDIRGLLSGSVTGTYIPYVSGNATPATEDQDKIWFKLDSFGRPLWPNIYYNGGWRRFASGIIGEVKYFSGVPATYFDNTGKGIVGADWDGWALCNGGNGTANLTDRFIVGAKLDDLSVGYNGGQWKSTVAGAAAATGGNKDVTLVTAQVPRAAEAAVTVAKWKADGNAADSGSQLYGTTPSSSNTVTLVPADAGNLSPTAVPTLPPWYALALVTWIGFD